MDTANQYNTRNRTQYLSDFSMDVIIPVASADECQLQFLLPSAVQLVEDLQAYNINVIFSVNDDITLEKFLLAKGVNDKIKVICADDARRVYKNNKSNNISYAVDYSVSNAVLLLDDDVIIEADSILHAWRQLQLDGIVKFMTHYERPDFYDRMDLFGIYFVNMICDDRQFWGNIGVRAEYIRGGRYRGNGLFDDLAIFRSCKWQGASFSYVSKPAMSMRGRLRTLRNFIEQRVRYSYENFAYPVRTVSYMSLIPSALAVGVILGLWVVLPFLLIVALLVAATAEIGRKRFGGQKIGNMFIYGCAYAAINSVSVWAAMVARMRGGVRFGTSIIREAV
ncbi:glycosyltransferase family 2 protein [Agrobacterium leguminum]|uniref:Glycosyltransferase n=1 Tax=Agrobacterium deltaense NCPPB 1641 TaxID=1183425 RepID=A0A1S7TSM9_9HYPH|nr:MULTISPECIES: glycosyltransferase family 2 protein [Agrobacterium]WFS69310.1 glycosyltransferase family 2 protein [Agrobacterium leguminum]CVI57340.1 hypothetical protein AGR7A_Lc10035 [Agrobacterium deltaense NCPPB 1641]